MIKWRVITVKWMRVLLLAEVCLSPSCQIWINAYQVNNSIKIFFEISEYFYTLPVNILQSLRNRMVKTVFENSIFFTIESRLQNFCLHWHIPVYGRNFLQAIFNGKNFEFSKTVFTIRFLRLWRMFTAREQKFSEISKFLLMIPSIKNRTNSGPTITQNVRNHWCSRWRMAWAMYSYIDKGWCWMRFNWRSSKISSQVFQIAIFTKKKTDSMISPCSVQPDAYSVTSIE